MKRRNGAPKRRNGRFCNDARSDDRREGGDGKDISMRGSVD